MSTIKLMFQPRIYPILLLITEGFHYGATAGAQGEIDVALGFRLPSMTH